MMVLRMVLRLFGLALVQGFRNSRCKAYYVVSRNFAARYEGWLARKRRPAKQKKVENNETKI